MYKRVSNRKETGDVMIDKRIGQRIKECRERIGLTQEQFSEKTGLSVNYISTVERGGSFPRCERLITILNGLQVSEMCIRDRPAPRRVRQLLYPRMYADQPHQRL